MVSMPTRGGRTSRIAFPLLVQSGTPFIRAPELGHNIGGMCSLTDDKPSVAIDRELGQGKTLALSRPRIRCPLCAWTPRKHDHWFCDCGHFWNTFETGESDPPASIIGLRP
jgi:hypothetical protein